ncbi:TROVE domain-containing protein [bacterium]|nr:MAG: TROVE domain-containing protein [bacterium]
MAKLNKAVKTDPIYTHEGARATRINPYLELRRSVCSCMLWESEFYEDGQTIAQRIADTIKLCKPEQVAALAIEAREKFKLRHVPLLLVRELARTGYKGTADTLAKVIQRPDEMTEFLSLYWKEGRCPVSSQVKKGLAAAFPKFNEYQLAKYNRAEAVKLRDVLFLSHAKPLSSEQVETWKKLIDGTLAAPDTWEVALSSGADKKSTWERLLTDAKLGALALLRNLRNMKEAGVDQQSIFTALEKMKVDRVLPFRFISAARYAPQWEPQLEVAMLKCLWVQEKLPGHTVMLLDVSGSMDAALSEKSDLHRLDAACGVAMLLREICEQVDIYTFSMKLVQIPTRHGFALRDAICNSQQHSGTPLGLAVKSIYDTKGVKTNTLEFGYHGRQDVDYKGQGLRPDRLIVITDEQSADNVPAPIGKGYMINVASSRNGVGYGAWTHVDGFSEAVIGWVREFESLKEGPPMI